MKLTELAREFRQYPGKLESDFKRFVCLILDISEIEFDSILTHTRSLNVYLDGLVDNIRLLEMASLSTKEIEKKIEEINANGIVFNVSEINMLRVLTDRKKLKIALGGYFIYENTAN